jgi:hypothetical protein
MSLNFLFVLKWLIPELKHFSRCEIESMVEIARVASGPRIRKYAGYGFAISFFSPPILLVLLFTKLNLLFGKMHFIFYGLVIALTIICMFLLMSVFYSIILRPAIQDQLRQKSRPSRASA